MTQKSGRIRVRWDDGLTAIRDADGTWQCRDLFVEKILNADPAWRLVADSPTSLAKEAARLFRGTLVEPVPAKLGSLKKATVRLSRRTIPGTIEKAFRRSQPAIKRDRH